MNNQPFEIFGKERRGPWIITCDHASNHVPDWIGGGDLGIAAGDMARHIAYDVGARGVAVALGEALDAPVAASRFSRLVIDPNRGEDDPTLIMQLYDGTIIPANRNLGADGREARLARLYRPYHDAVEALASAEQDRAIVAIHSFTPQLRGRPPRPWHVTVLFADQDPRLGRAVVTELEAEQDLIVGANVPYTGYLPGDSIDRHALQTGRLNALIEIRNDLIETEEAQAAWGQRLAPIVARAAKGVGHAV